MSRWSRRERVFGATSIGAVALAAAALFNPLASAATDPANPTQAEALAGLGDAQTYIRNHPDVTATPTASATPSSSPSSTPSASATTPAAGTVALTVVPSTSGSSGQAVASWSIAAAGRTVDHLQVGRDGTDTTGAGPWNTGSQPATVTTWTFDKLTPGGTYTIAIDVTFTDGSVAHDAKLTTIPAAGSTPSATASATASSSPTTSPAGGLVSGMSWSSGVWNDQDASQTAAFTSGPRAGAPVDNVLVYTSRANQAAQNNAAAWRAALPSGFNGVGQDLVLAVTSVTSDGASMTAAQAQAIGTALCSVDGTAPIVRLDWEMNLADGGNNGADLNASNYAAWVARFGTVADGIHSTCASARFDFNPNHGTDQGAGCNSGTYAWPNNCSRRAFQALKTKVAFFGIDTYDSYPPVTASGSGWNTRLTGNNEMTEAYNYAQTNGKLFSVPEWGVACNVSGCQWAGNAGGDDPEYVNRMMDFYGSHTAGMGYETYFNEPATYIVTDLIAHNPNSRAAYAAKVRQYSSKV